ncbi:alpha/beta fold hydrolase [Geobacter pickeringii]|uniref:O-methylpimelyl-ACP methylesterase n=1 Tax=Geobacter pickeringii TaxID=345632 RepID=A0A0B5BDH1_9BACT|nr:alpha/beta fold hydrolase [Geobacter pickeringii]AJE02585.1 O-methylpimelyl-ACP methylesterase [Geobacter pickeringii]
MAFIDTAPNVSIHYEEEGDGFPVVLVHGWAMSGRVWAFQRELAGRFRLITPDLRGHGKSAAPEEGYAFADFAADLVALFDRLEIRRGGLVGWSLGAQVALEAYPPLAARLAALVLVGGTPKFTASAEWPFGLPATEARGLALRLRRGYDRTMGEFFRGMFAAGELDREANQRIAREIVIPRLLPDPRGVAATLDTLAGGDHRAMLGRVKTPTLVIHGGEDAICPPDAGRFLAERIGGARLALLDGAGHAPFLSDPARFNRLVGEFLEEVIAGD